MRIRKTRRSDFQRIDEIYRDYHQDKFGLPNLDNAVTHAVVERDGKILGFGIVKLYAEAIMVLDLDESKIHRLKAMDKLMSEAYRGCDEIGLDQMHVFVQDPKLMTLLIQKYGFKIATGVALVKELSNGKRGNKENESNAGYSTGGPE